MQYAPTEFVTSASGFTSLGLGLYATFTCVDTYALAVGSDAERGNDKFIHL